MAGRQHPGPESTSWCFPVAIAIVSLVYNVLVALSCAYLPDDPLYIGLSVQLYAWAGSALSVIGLFGIVTKQPALTTSFAHLLLLDTLVSAIVRLLVLQFFFEAFYDHNVCTASYDPTWSPRNFRHDIVTSVRYQKEYLWQKSNRRRCRAALSAVQIVLIGLVVCLTGAQCSLAITMRKYGKELKGRQARMATKSTFRCGDAKPRRSPEPSTSSDEKSRLESA
ncbi:hypothetical protein CERZMDRAFT_56805 [Cercospora zeae-maydis SCOH1-5]|uniref:Uncharacterized protein n=1 Tax=Cercospora zeae-maydis SCOH1-5 TaxID=717836 RepID=A0A6A6FPE2_9PEZI|nr:hypothetical protein CERZMDRAFT_56805 [Cercospora zeae-maydis SCOH1-5]